ncbi:MAG: hypothetical protein AAFQ80_12585 [Cyanobacteria bacterium J06621_8]
MNNDSIKLSTQEKLRFRSLTDKILNQQSQINLLSDSDKEEYLQLLNKLDLIPESYRLQEKDNIFNIAIGSLFIISFYILFVGVPITISLLLNISSIFILYIIISGTAVSILAVAALMGTGRVSWRFLTNIFILFLAGGIILFFILKNFA